MLFMVVEHFGRGLEPVGERFRRQGRMLPEGVVYIHSWMAADGTMCFQVMEAADRAALEPWLARWRDLVDFEVVQVQASAEFWAARLAT